MEPYALSSLRGSGRRTGFLLGTVAAVVVGAGWMLASPMAASAADPEAELDCGSGLRVVAIYDHFEDGSAVRDPETQAWEWRRTGAGPSRPHLDGYRMYRPSESVTKVGFTDRAGNTVAVLVFNKRDPGWLLDSTVECA